MSAMCSSSHCRSTCRPVCTERRIVRPE
jgi:hypothetical protein